MRFIGIFFHQFSVKNIIVLFEFLMRIIAVFRRIIQI